MHLNLEGQYTEVNSREALYRYMMQNIYFINCACINIELPLSECLFGNIIVFFESRRICNNESRNTFMHTSCSRTTDRGARWLSGRVSDSGARGPGFETYLRRVVSLSKTLYSLKVLVNYPGSDGSVPT